MDAADGTTALTVFVAGRCGRGCRRDRRRALLPFLELSGRPRAAPRAEERSQRPRLPRASPANGRWSDEALRLRGSGDQCAAQVGKRSSGVWPSPCGSQGRSPWAGRFGDRLRAVAPPRVRPGHSQPRRLEQARGHTVVLDRDLAHRVDRHRGGPATLVEAVDRGVQLGDAEFDAKYVALGVTGCGASGNGLDRRAPKSLDEDWLQGAATITPAIAANASGVTGSARAMSSGPSAWSSARRSVPSTWRIAR